MLRNVLLKYKGMKNFIILLAKGLAIAVIAALVICYALWSLASLRRIAWLFITTIVITVMSRVYFDDTNKNWRERLLTMLGAGGSLVILGFLLTGIGYVVAWLFNLSAGFFEVYALYGLICCITICILVICVAYIIELITNSKQRQLAWNILLKFIMCFAIIISCLVVFGLILYYLVPIVI